jgi:hypothetical protein
MIRVVKMLRGKTTAFLEAGPEGSLSKIEIYQSWYQCSDIYI